MKCPGINIYNSISGESGDSCNQFAGSIEN
jgi:hypothetical protein